MRVTMYINPNQEESCDLIDFLLAYTWSGANDRLRCATDGQLEEVVSVLQYSFDEPTDMTTVNDFIWFECDSIFDDEDEA